MTEHFVDQLEARARERLPDEVYRYIRQGSADSVAADEAVGAWDRWRFVPRVLRDVTDVGTTTTLLGTELRSPLAVAPTTLQRAAHEDGELATARAVKAAGSLLVLSSNAGTPFAEIGDTGVPWWLQMYVTADRRLTEPVVVAAVDAGARALVLTADTPVVGTKTTGERSVWESIRPGWLRVNFPEDTSGSGAEKATDLGPHDIAWLKDTFGLPVVVKGVLHPTDARRCVEAGADAVWVSNHGGRQLPRAIATADALAGVVEEVGPEAEVYVDGGLRRGVHVMAAGALGARACFLGRPALYALAADGTDGVERLVSGLETELVEALRLVGVGSFAELDCTVLAGAAGVPQAEGDPGFASPTTRP